MKIKVEENHELNDVEIIINCPKKDNEVEKLVSLIETYYFNIMGKIDGVSYVLNLKDIYYFEAVDNHVFAYTKDLVYEVSYKIQELNEMLSNSYFIQVTRTVVLNIKKINKVNTLVNGRILAYLSNGEKLIITRVYAQTFKQKLKE